MPILNGNGGLELLIGFVSFRVWIMELWVFIPLSIKYDLYVCLVDGTLLWYREKKE